MQSRPLSVSGRVQEPSWKLHTLQARRRVRVPKPSAILTAKTTNLDRRC
jgi:hypothetical protein